MALHNLTLAVVIPSYKAAASLPAVIKGIPDFIDHIVVVDDGSSDGTSDSARSVADPRITLLIHEKNQGVGGATLTGYKKACELGADILVKMDADGQMKPDLLPHLLKPILHGHAHYTKGNRFGDLTALQSMPPVRRLGNALHSLMTKLVSGYWNVFDVTNGYTALLAKTFCRLDSKAIARDYFFETSMLIELNIIGAKIVDVDMLPVYEGEKSHIRVHHIATRFPILLAKGVWRRFYLRYVLRDFGALTLCAVSGVPIFAFGVIYGASLWISPPHPGEPTPAGMVMFAALPIIIGFQLILTALILDVVFTPNRAPRDEA
jgi:glycosyltransferase involved in cell wall biosynthesis